MKDNNYKAMAVAIVAMFALVGSTMFIYMDDSEAVGSGDGSSADNTYEVTIYPGWTYTYIPTYDNNIITPVVEAKYDEAVTTDAIITVDTSSKDRIKIKCSTDDTKVEAIGKGKEYIIQVIGGIEDSYANTVKTEPFFLQINVKKTQPEALDGKNSWVAENKTYELPSVFFVDENVYPTTWSGVPGENESTDTIELDFSDDNAPVVTAKTAATHEFTLEATIGEDSEIREKLEIPVSFIAEEKIVINADPRNIVIVNVPGEGEAWTQKSTFPVLTPAEGVTWEITMIDNTLYGNSDQQIQITQTGQFSLNITEGSKFNGVSNVTVRAQSTNGNYTDPLEIPVIIEDQMTIEIDLDTVGSTPVEEPVTLLQGISYTFKATIVGYQAGLTWTASIAGVVGTIAITVEDDDVSDDNLYNVKFTPTSTVATSSAFTISTTTTGGQNVSDSFNVIIGPSSLSFTNAPVNGGNLYVA